MPLVLSNNHRIPLRNEMTDMDFDRAPGLDWLWDNFAIVKPLHPLRCRENDDIKLSLAAFCNETLRGPYYISTGEQQGHAGYMMLTPGIVIIHPDDRKDFTHRFVGENWEEKPKAVEKNAAILVNQMISGYAYENSDMTQLLNEIRTSSLPVVPNANDINKIATRLWPKCTQPLAPRNAGLLPSPSQG